MSGSPVFEQTDGPGGICRSYYVRPHTSDRLDHAPPDEDAYRFEIGGGHWIFGSDPAAVEGLGAIVALRSYQRRAAIRLDEAGSTVPYPLQANTQHLTAALQRRMMDDPQPTPGPLGSSATLREWLLQSFGATLCELFFFPFNQRYTAGLMDVIAPQDQYKSPSREARKFPGGTGVGYNGRFCYPAMGLDGFAAALADGSDIRYGKRLVGIATDERLLCFDDGSEQPYSDVLSTVPLHRALELADVKVGEEPDPYTSVLVLNVGAERGPSCPDVHWLYEPDAAAGFHRIGFYSNVDTSFLPRELRRGQQAVSLYVERAYRAGEEPSSAEVAAYAHAVIAELQARDYIGAVHVVDPSWVEVAYTWRYPGSSWQAAGIDALAAHGIHQVGRYGRWHFQGIAESVRDGLEIGNQFRAHA